MTHSTIALFITIVMSALVVAQETRPMSPQGRRPAQAGGNGETPPGRGAQPLGGETCQGGKWMEFTYGGPPRGGRALWGSAADYGRAALVATPIWRAGANVSTRLKTDV